MHEQIYDSRGRLLLMVAISLVAAIFCFFALGCSSAQPPASPSRAEDSRPSVESRQAETDRRLDPAVPPSVPTSPPADASQRELQQRMLDALMLEAARQQARQARAEANRRRDCEACELLAASRN